MSIDSLHLLFTVLHPDDSFKSDDESNGIGEEIDGSVKKKVYTSFSHELA